jgi:hypothetical protein
MVYDALDDLQQDLVIFMSCDRGYWSLKTQLDCTVDVDMQTL